jgi:alkylation response protein AidB-like acyl-CoA dehydrogenase
MDFSLSSELLELQARTRDFVATTIIPLEHDERQTPHGPAESLRTELVDRARRVGLLTPHASPDMGGLGLSHMAKAVVFEDVLNGTKWFITGAEGATFAIIMARMEDGSATMFLADMHQPGIRLERLMDSLDSCFVGGPASSI